jgi:hypothetical protein
MDAYEILRLKVSTTGPELTTRTCIRAQPFAVHESAIVSCLTFFCNDCKTLSFSTFLSVEFVL